MRQEKTVLLICTMLILAFNLNAQDVQLSDTDDIAEAEFHVAINPTDTNNIVVCSMHGFSGIEDSYFSIYFTENFGGSWELSDFQGKYDGHAGAGDPVLSFDAEGNLYLVHLVGTEDGTAVLTLLSKSVDKGKTWELVYTYPSVFTDKPWLAIDRGPDSPNKGNVYIPDVAGGVRLITLNSDNTLLRDPTIPDIDHLPSVVVGLDGDVYTSGMRWDTDPIELWVQHYSDAGENLISSVPLASTPDYTFDVDDISFRFQPCPYLAIDNSNGPYSGRLYFSYTRSEEDDERFFDVLLRYSDDKGLTWSEPKAVHSNLDFHVQQFYSSLFVNDDGVLIMDWYDRKNFGAESLNTDFFMGVSHDGGDSFTEIKLNTQPMDFQQVVTAGFFFGIGEYHQLVATTKTAVSFWSDGRKNDGDLNIYYAKVDINNPISGVKEFGLIQDKISISNVYPVPANDKFFVDISLKKSYNIKYQLTDINGKLILDGPWQKYTKGKNTIEVSNNIFSGTYIITLSTDTGYSKSMKLIKE